MCVCVCACACACVDAQVVEAASGKASGGQALEGFGIITLASSFPILAVEILSITLSLVYTCVTTRFDIISNNP